MLKLRKILLQDKLYKYIVLIIITLALIFTNCIKFKSKYEETTTLFKCKIEDYEIDGNVLSLNLSCKEKLNATYYLKTQKEKEYYEKNLIIGGTYEIKGSLQKPNNNTIPYGFNYKKYLYYKKIYYTLNIENIKLINKKTNILYKLKNYLYKKINNKNSYYYTFILGKNYKIKENVLESYRTNGISHLFALSGLHVSIFSMILLKILKKLKTNELLTYIIIFIFLLIFSFITGFSPSILRASLLFFLLGINKVFYFYIKTENILYLVLIILTILNPFIIYDISFLLSFITTYFLVISSDLISSKNYIISLLKVSIVAFLGSLILSLYYFNKINLISIFLNLIFVPLVTFCVFPLSIISFIFPPFRVLFNISTSILENLSLLLTNIKLIIMFPHINKICVLIYYILLYIIIKTKNKKAIILLIILLITLKIKPYLNNETKVYFIDVGQGDSSLIVTPHLKKVILIDTGGIKPYKKEKWALTNNEYSLGKDTLIPLFINLGITKIDYLILTHGDYDHLGEASTLIKNFKIKNIIINKGEINSLESSIKNAQTITKENFKIDNITIKSLNNKIYNNENDNGIVLLLKIEKTKLLFTADISTKVESDILKNYNLEEVDILKVAHHGSKTSSSSNFIDKIKPKISIIMSKENNSFNHPHKEVVNRLSSYSQVLNTAYSGTIEITIKNNYKIKTYKRYT